MGVTADITFGGDAALTTVCVERDLRFALHEVLKNALTAHQSQYGTDADLGPAIEVSAVARAGGRRCLTVRDRGAGLTAAQMKRARSWLSTKVENDVSAGEVGGRNDDEAQWRYTRLMGAQYSGYGAGLPLAEIMCRAMGGGLAMRSDFGVGNKAADPQEGGGCEVEIWVDAEGRVYG